MENFYQPLSDLVQSGGGVVDFIFDYILANHIVLHFLIVLLIFAILRKSGQIDIYNTYKQKKAKVIKNQNYQF